ncbi:MAG: helix-turn-helix transcriptional regulator [Bacteroidales bacterium]|nr:helix-turn-helix transcriptional regulator [Bacteroidales bacterium]
MEWTTMSDSAISNEIGKRIKSIRLQKNTSQAELANISGLTRNTLSNIENGKHCTLSSLIKILRGLKMLDGIDELLPSEAISPIQMANMQGKKRNRASGNRSDLNSKKNIEW